MLKQNSFFTISILLFVISIDTNLYAKLTVYMNANVGEAYQLEQETLFLEKLNDPNVVVDFDDLSAGSINGNEWRQFGVIFSQPDDFGLRLLAADENRTPNSSPNCLWPSSGGERIEMTFDPMKTAIGFWLIDSEYNDVLNDTIIFYDSEDNVLLSIPLPFTDYVTNSKKGNFFIGVISNEPISRVVINEIALDNETVGIDDLYFEGGPHLGCIFPPGDLNKDCKVNLEDLSIIAKNWLVDCDADPFDPACSP